MIKNAIRFWKKRPLKIFMVFLGWIAIWSLLSGFAPTIDFVGSFGTSVILAVSVLFLFAVTAVEGADILWRTEIDGEKASGSHD